MIRTHLNISTSTEEIQHEPWFDSDRWDPEQIGLSPDPVHSSYYINFAHFKQPWLKKAMKQFVIFQASTKSFASCRSYTVNLAYFSRFLEEKYPEIIPHQITRKVMVDYLIYLNKLGLSQSTRQIALRHFRTFHTIMLQEKWLPLPYEPLIYSSDLPKLSTPIPRFIPQYVISQLKQHLHQLTLPMQHFIIVLLETGRRVSEICTLPYDCLESDGSDGIFLRVHDKKLKKHYLIPISPVCVETIKKQQQWVNRLAQPRFHAASTQSSTFLFPSSSSVDKRGLYVRARSVNWMLNQLAVQNNILDENGQLWHFHAHQFRHTLGTRMINSGVPQAIVQRYLGHESPEMTARYAYIHHDTLKKSFQTFQTTFVDATGIKRPISLDQQDAFLLKQHIMNQALPNGLCGLPLIQQRCPHANACLTCTHFRTHKGFLPQHEAQLKETNRIIHDAHSQGFQRQVEMNMTVKQNLEKIIERLKQEPDHE